MRLETFVSVFLNVANSTAGDRMLAVQDPRCARCVGRRQRSCTISPAGSCVRRARRRRPAATLLQLAPRPRHQWLQDFVSLRAARAHDQANARAGDRGLAYVWMHPDEDR